MIHASKNAQGTQTLNWILKEYKIKAEHFEFEYDINCELKKAATKKAIKASQKASKQGIHEDCLAILSGIYLEDRLLDNKTYQNLLLTTPTKCELRSYLAYVNLNEPNSLPKNFEHTVVGILSSRPKGNHQDYHGSKNSMIFIPKDTQNKTLAELSFMEYKYWFSDNAKHIRQFAAWYVEHYNRK